jgi:hypothetical protein
VTPAAPKNGELDALETRISQPLSAFVVGVRGAVLACRNFARQRAHGIGDKAAFATVRPTSELEQSAFVAFSPKNGPHRASRRLPGDPTLERVEGQFQ